MNSSNKTIGIAKLVSSLNYREANLVPVTWYNREIAAYTPRVKAAVDAVRRSQIAAELLAEHYGSMLWGSSRDSARMSRMLELATKSERDSLDYRMRYLVDVVKVDLGRRVGAALEIELGMVHDCPAEMDSDYGSCPACAGSGMGGRMVGDERTGEIRCSCCGHYAAE